MWVMRIAEGLEFMRTSRGRRWLRKTVRERLYSKRESVCLRRDLSIPFVPPPAKIPFTVRELHSNDDLTIFADEPGLSPKSAQLRADQRWLLSRDLPTPMVAVDSAGKICFMVWLLTAKDNARIRSVWGDWLPEIGPDEVLLEGLYTVDSYRGLGIMAPAATEIAERAQDMGVRYGLGFIASGNTPSLRGGQKAGWIPYLKREDRWLLFRRRTRFIPLNDEIGMTVADSIRPVGGE